MFKKELEFFIANQKKLVKKHRGKILVIRGQVVAGVYEDVLEAFLEAQKKYKIGTFMIQPCLPGPSAYTVTVSSNAIFSR
jgi:hypothetical protein